MAIALSKLEKYFYIDKLVIHSIDLALYQASVVIDGQESMIIDDSGLLLREHSILAMQKRCRHLKANTHVLRQSSAYDEMVGQPTRETANTLEVPIGNHKLY
ncbi:DUF6482 family protein [Vibrio sagamiensis]|uniref:Uncharacterized protein n=1 Tax=Vibrio sagamiensis NBRC 104589 TaxID=1219064 RepID=A0A511QCN3_9VIBR|nr:DUF6482 family protein [Vibrio sagamiensis]PNQ54204.1 hypothetical protein C1141_17115 [Vibrio agarivorans]GEM75054.1 hypothetical protein VSA01S_11660 [Vibrio sagamiensis NBRC 104589]